MKQEPVIWVCPRDRKDRCGWTMSGESVREMVGLAEVLEVLAFLLSQMEEALKPFSRIWFLIRFLSKFLYFPSDFLSTFYFSQLSKFPH